MSVRKVLPAELVDCPECGAVPYHRCTSANGSGRNEPHGKRTARLHGLKATPRRGCFVPAHRSGLEYREDEIKACAEHGISLPFKVVTK